MSNSDHIRAARGAGKQEAHGALQSVIWQEDNPVPACAGTSCQSASEFSPVVSNSGSRSGTPLAADSFTRTCREVRKWYRYSRVNYAVKGRACENSLEGYERKGMGNVPHRTCVDKYLKVPCVEIRVRLMAESVATLFGALVVS